jgi:hypothetical protein
LSLYSLQDSKKEPFVLPGKDVDCTKESAAIWGPVQSQLVEDTEIEAFNLGRLQALKESLILQEVEEHR